MLSHVSQQPISGQPTAWHSAYPVANLLANGAMVQTTDSLHTLFFDRFLSDTSTNFLITATVYVQCNTIE